MNGNRQKWLAIGILAGVFLLGFLAGISSARPLKTVIPARSAAEDPRPEEFVQAFSSRMTDLLHLTEEQRPTVEEHLRTMAEEIREHQRSFIPRITGSITNAIDRILPSLKPEQQERLRHYRQSTIDNSPVGAIGRPPGPGSGVRRSGFRGPPGQGFGRPERRPWGPPPHHSGMGQDPSAHSGRPQRPPLE